MRTYHVDMNVTLSVDERLVKRARRSAAAMGKSLNHVQVTGTPEARHDRVICDLA